MALWKEDLFLRMREPRRGTLESDAAMRLPLIHQPNTNIFDGHRCKTFTIKIFRLKSLQVSNQNDIFAENKPKKLTKKLKLWPTFQDVRFFRK